MRKTSLMEATLDPKDRYDSSGEAFESDIRELYKIPGHEDDPENEEIPGHEDEPE